MSLPHVTGIIGASARSWSPFETISPGVLENASDRGLAVHGICCLHARKLWISDVPLDCQGYFLSFKKWWDSHVRRVHLVEKVLSDPDRGFSGRPDLVISLVGDATGLTLLDIKTPAVQQKGWRLQTAGYRHLGTLAGYDIRRHGCLRLAADGGNALMDEYTDTYAYDLNVFWSCLNVWNFFAGAQNE